MSSQSLSTLSSLAALMTTMANQSEAIIQHFENTKIGYGLTSFSGSSWDIDNDGQADAEFRPRGDPFSVMLGVAGTNTFQWVADTTVLSPGGTVRRGPLNLTAAYIVRPFGNWESGNFATSSKAVALVNGADNSFKNILGFKAVENGPYAYVSQTASGQYIPGSLSGTIGFRFKRGSDDYQHGWATLVVSNFETGYAVITEWAYEDSGAPIVAGSITPIPEPTIVATSLGVLALGAAGLHRWRKLREARSTS
ncbi:hypothetical protein [Rubellicoccus peritrichatus]|uniref:PEP-CTERM protein-sorting domain-containing protein n=1 Tax=Rubellicoccus peritrichatus TaxID=3080537 RepID=A0AAQ3L798_9BACT|nr:hypothetical protein [Puniceicoccus sp. CR14]WOO40301.1 hypothetical protein RZN69_16905 [Puniceicoccus sp. CR14]